MATNLSRLIDSVVRQTMVLVAELATNGGARTPIPQPFPSGK